MTGNEGVEDWQKFCLHVKCFIDPSIDISPSNVHKRCGKLGYQFSQNSTAILARPPATSRFIEASTHLLIPSGLLEHKIPRTQLNAALAGSATAKQHAWAAVGAN
jgi:hypothetical protein